VCVCVHMCEVERVCVCVCVCVCAEEATQTFLLPGESECVREKERVCV